MKNTNLISMDKSIEDSKEWMSVPAFGDWDKLKGIPADYTMDFTKIRESRKQSKLDYNSISLGNDSELLSRSMAPAGSNPSLQRRQSPPEKKLVSYFMCCGGSKMAS